MAADVLRGPLLPTQLPRGLRPESQAPEKRDCCSPFRPPWVWNQSWTRWALPSLSLNLLVISPLAHPHCSGDRQLLLHTGHPHPQSPALRAVSLTHWPSLSLGFLVYHLVLEISLWIPWPHTQKKYWVRGLKYHYCYVIDTEYFVKSIHVWHYTKCCIYILCVASRCCKGSATAAVLSSVVQLDRCCSSWSWNLILEPKLPPL